MTDFSLKQSRKLQLTSYAGLTLIGQCCKASQVEPHLDRHIPVSQGLKSSDLFKCMVGFISLGKSDFEAIEEFRRDRYFHEALGVSKVPSSAWLRQRLDLVAAQLREYSDEYSLRLIERTGAPITMHMGYVTLDMDTFVMDNSGTKKAEVQRTYQGVDGYCPIAIYLGNEGYALGLELRPGSQHSVFETDYFLERTLPRAKRLVNPEHPVLFRADSGFDSACMLMTCQLEREGWAADSRVLEYLIKWNPRKQNKEAWVALADEACVFKTVRDGKRVALLEKQVERKWSGEKRNYRLVVRVTERTIDKRGQALLIPQIELEGWWTSLTEAPEKVIERYRHHGTHEQFHSELKSDLDLERLPSGKFDTNDAVLHVAMFAYNSLRIIGQLGLTGELSPLRHPAKRRRIKTVLQDIMCRAAKVVFHARQCVLDFGRGVERHVNAFKAVHDWLGQAAP